MAEIDAAWLQYWSECNRLARSQEFGYVDWLEAWSVLPAVAIFLAIKLQTINVAFLVGLAFAVAASANLPALLMALSEQFETWRQRHARLSRELRDQRLLIKLPKAS